MEEDVYYDEKLEEIKKKKLLEYQKALEKAKAMELKRAQEEAKKQAILMKILTPKARQRLSNLRLVKPELVDAVEIQLIHLAQSGRIQLPISDDLLKKLLAEVASRTRKEIKIRF